MDKNSEKRIKMSLYTVEILSREGKYFIWEVLLYMVTLQELRNN